MSDSTATPHVDVSLDGYRTAHLYTVSETARFAQTSTRTVRRWLFDYDGAPPVLDYESLRGDQSGRAVVSFLQLLELKIALGFRRTRHVRLERVRRGHSYLKERFGLEYPFASMPLATLGGRILAEFETAEPGPHLLEAGGVQSAMPGIVTATLQAFDFADDDLAERWHPVGRTVPIVLDPYVNAGVPTVEDRRLAIQTIYKRHRAGQPEDFIARDLDIEVPKLRLILTYAQGVRLAA